MSDKITTPEQARAAVESLEFYNPIEKFCEHHDFISVEKVGEIIEAAMLSVCENHGKLTDDAADWMLFADKLQQAQP